MTKVQNPIIGRAKGSAGGMTFSKNSDQNVMRAKAFEVNNPKTTAQTTQRDFFKEVQSIVDSVSPEQLRSLFGDKPKKMSRRNALFKQVAAAYSVDGTTKSVDFSKLLAIGNGEKVYTEMIEIEDGNFVTTNKYSPAMLGLQTFDNTNIILVVFDAASNSIKILNREEVYEEGSSLSEIVGVLDESINGYCYPTCAKNGENVYQRGFGSFIIKTRKEK